MQKQLKGKKMSKKRLYEWRGFINQLEIGMYRHPCEICGMHHGKPYTRKELGVAV
jgi:hypothetical protein